MDDYDLEKCLSEEMAEEMLRELHVNLVQTTANFVRKTLTRETHEAKDKIDANYIRKRGGSDIGGHRRCERQT